MQVQVQEMAPECLASACLPGPHYLRRYFLPKSPSWEKEQMRAKQNVGSVEIVCQR